MPAYDQALNSLLSFGLIQSSASISDSIDALATFGPTEAAAIIAKHKVRRIAKKRIESASVDATRGSAQMLGEFMSEITRLGAAREARNTNLYGQIAKLRTLSADLPVRLMKGLGVRSWYSSHHPRDLGDADLWLPDMDSGLELVGMLREHGFGYEPGEMPFLKRDSDGHLLGQFRMRHPDPSQMVYDIHIGAYSVRYCGIIGFERSWDGVRWTPLADEDNLCAIIGNAAGDCFVEAKAINDICLALERPVDLQYVARVLSDADLTGFVNGLFECISQACSLRDDQVERLAELRTSDPAEDVHLIPSDDDARRTKLVTSHAFRVAERLTGDREAAERIAGDAEQAYGRPKSFRLRTSGGNPLRMPELNPWTCVRLAPQPLMRRIADRHNGIPAQGRQTELARNLHLLTLDIGDLVRFRSDVFLPTINYLFCSDLVTADPDCS